ncbi:L,D-transpeptidase [Streptomyces sp. NPDC001922]|uniref:L,D-transpeptidase n=1 Tax=Streptomyces sp. NPDC001922 TaxID=3364624 RepID=UPI0036A8B964
MRPPVKTVQRRGRPAAAAVAIAVLMPLTVATAAVADAGDPQPPDGKGAVAVPLDRLVPGIPPGPHERHVDTPDQALPPQIPQSTPGTAETSPAPDTREAPDAHAAPDARKDPGSPKDPGPGTAPQRHPDPRAPGPYAPPPADEPIVEFVPPDEVQPGDEAAGPLRCTHAVGPYQREVEDFLELPVDGRQSKEDCEAIRDWQTKENITPAIGFAGPSSYGHIRLLRAVPDPNAAGDCPEVAERVACVDLPRQLMWVQEGTKVVFGPVAIRSGKPGYPTRVGWNRVYWRNKDHVSSIYHSPMPFAQFFNGGQAFHGVYGNIYDPDEGSFGCVNLRYGDAERMWDALRLDDRVYSWGRRPGT